MKLYISGKISSPDPEEVKKNLALFDKEAEKFKKQEYYDVVNPASLEGECSSWEEYLARDLLIIHRYAPEIEIWLLPNWKESLGARLEVEYAKRLGLKIHNE